MAVWDLNSNLDVFGMQTFLRGLIGPSMTCLLYWLIGFRGEDFKTFFPIGSYVKTTVCPLKAAILDFRDTTKHKSFNRE
jgi:hypothetical protein